MMDVLNIKVSIVIPIYKAEAFLDECIQSVLAQSYQNLEIILVDDGSTDACPQMCDDYAKHDSRIKVIHQTNKGLSAARNRGIKETTGDYLYFLDSDDKLFPHSISTLIKYVEKYPGIDMVMGNVECENGIHNFLHFAEGVNDEYYQGGEKIGAKMLSMSTDVVWNRLIKRNLFIEKGLYFSTEIAIHEDDVWLWSARKHIKSLAVCEKNTYWYRTNNPGSITKSKDKSMLSRIKIVQMFAPEIETKEEMFFVLGMITPERKLLVWDKLKNPAEVMQALASLKNNISGKAKSLICFEALLWRLPCWMINNRIFVKLHHEWLKHQASKLV